MNNKTIASLYDDWHNWTLQPLELHIYLCSKYERSLLLTKHFLPPAYDSHSSIRCFSAELLKPLI